MRRHEKASTAGSNQRHGGPLLVVAAAALALSLALGVALAGATAPTVTIEPAEAGFTTAKVKGNVNPEGHSTAWRFQYIGDAQYQQNLTEALPGFQGAIDGPSGSVESAEAVEGEITGLTQNTTYHLRLFAENADGPDVAVAPNFTTKEVAAPTLPKVEVTEVEYTTAKASGEVEVADPDEAFNASCRFEYVTDQQFTDEGNSFAAAEPNGQVAGCSTNPVLGSETQPVPVEAQLSGLHHTLYHLRLAATNQGGTAFAVASTFETKEVTAPVVTVADAGSITGSSAHFSGTVDPGGSAGEFNASCTFDYVKDFQFLIDGFASAGQVGCNENPVTGAGSTAVHADPNDLQPHTTYHLRLRAENVGGTITQVANTFSTEAAAPAVTTGPLLAFAEEARLRGFVNPLNSAIDDCHFDYGPTESYGQSTPCEATPSTDNQEHEVGAYVPGLSEVGEYHFRLVAESASGTTQGDDDTFIAPTDPSAVSCPNAVIRSEQHSTYLPDCRAYEQVSPTDKNGSDVMVYSPRTRASVDGNAVSYASLGGFGDVKGTGVAVEYLARRGAGGWVTHAITPTVDSNSFPALLSGGDLFLDGELSADFERGVFMSRQPLTDDPDVEDVINLYRSDDLANPGTYQLISACPLCAGAGALPPLAGDQGILQWYLPYLVGTSPDMEHVAFESILNLTSDAPAQSGFCGDASGLFPPPSPLFCRSRLYEWDHGVLRLAGILPDGTAADASFAGTRGRTRHLTPHTISDGSDGHSRIFFTQPTDGAGMTVSQLSDFEQVPLNVETPDGNLFMRVDHTSTVQLNVSERATPDTFAPAQYLDASADGERVFFATTQALTNDASTQGGNVFRYDASKPASAPDNLTLVTRDEEPGDTSTFFGLLGTSADGHYAYIVVSGQLLSGGPLSQRTIYLWHDGEIKEVGIIPPGASLNENFIGYPNDYGQSLRQSRVTPDGRHLVFTTIGGEGFGGYDHGPCRELGIGCREVYVYSADTGNLACASCNPSGAAATVHASVVAEDIHGGARVTTHQSRDISDDGRYVFFSTAEALVSRDTNGLSDAYEYDTVTNQVSLLSSGTEKSGSWFLEAGGTGRDAFIVTRERLAGSDKDNAYDLYDVRVGGGYTEPAPVPTPCAGESCRGAQAPAPAPATVGSGLEGTGNAKPNRPPHCPKGRHRVKTHNGKTRCVKSGHKSKKRTANANRRAGK